MFKKMLLSTLILSLIVINLILWPYLYKQSKDPEKVATPTVETASNGSSNTDSSDRQIDENASNDVVEDEQPPKEKEEEATGEDNETFRVVDIR